MLAAIRMKRAAASVALRVVLAAVTLTSLGIVAPVRMLPAANASTWVVDTYTRTEAEIRAAWRQFEPTYTGTPYVTVPSTCAPYTPGATTTAFRQDGLKMLNFGRYLAGLPADVTLLDSRDLDGQYGAVLLQTEFSHTPAQPPDMPDDFYERGLASVGSSNIGYGYLDLESFQKSCLYDGHPTNVARVGHRRWLLNPPMLYTGMGSAGTAYSQTMTTYAFDRSRPEGSVDYSFIAWPSAGLFPVEHAYQSLPWSITLNAARYDWDPSGHVVQLTRVSDGKSWTFDASDTDPSGEFFSADFSYRGSDGNAFIFRPASTDLVGSYSAGEQYDVTLSGGIYAEGTRTPATVKYRTSFCALSGEETEFGAPTVIFDATPLPGSAPDPTVTISGRTFVTVAGATRIETAIEASELGFSSSEYVVVATALAFPDALGGSALAGALDAPILLTYPTSLPDAVASEVARLNATTVIVLGGDGAVSPGVFDALDALPGVTAERIAGATRYSTAEKIAERTIEVMGVAFDGTAFVATGASFPDALGASPLAGAKGWPIYLLAPETTTHDALVAAMKADGVTRALALGGTGVVPATFETKLNAAFTDAKVDRLAGGDRYTTALAVARYGVASAGLAWDHVAIATGANFPDALAGGALQGADRSVMLLSAPTGLNTEVRTELTAQKASITEVRFLGGTGAVPQTIRDAVVQALQ
ncbi:MAG: cell wall-binding repeat-containing protein [Coriobacteriia bacterium]|nr:cell wall-binding repeat-containing protein [Coriobacteriia bacterium]MBN2839511.1 cell wall-binding repeat-containing protein [Coriobacteriia bacterium]